MNALILLIDAILGFYFWVVILSAVFSWLYAFNVINSSNQFVNTIGKFLFDLTEPVFRQVRRVIPTIGSVDLSPIVVLFAIMFLRNFVRFDLPGLL